ncbi:MAG: AarF/ABC1/UbiB kinase family protein, partial [Halobacteria archaeon]|nr:AarF/ABC1/UbiB kinase family protein [Halobacteria archaeon]
QIVIYDFGMSGRISPSLQQSFIDFYLAAANRDPDGVIDAMIEMGTLDRDVDRDIMRDVIEIAIQDLSGEDVDDLRIQQLIDEVEETVYEYPLRIPSYVALGLRVSTIVEGVCVELDPEFDFLAVAREFFIEEGYVQKQVRGRMAQAWEDMKDTVASIARTPSKFETGLDKLGRDDIEVVVDVEDSKEHIEKLGKRISYAIVGASAVIGSTILTMSSRAAEYALPMFGFGLLILYLVRRSFKKEKKVMGPKTYATRHQAEKMQEKEEGEGVSPEREEELEEGRTYGDLNTGR